MYQLEQSKNWLKKAINRHERHLSGNEATSISSQNKLMNEMENSYELLEKMMSAKSAKQYKMMAAIAHGAAPRHGVGPSPEVAREFVEKTPKEKRSLFMKKKGKK